MDFLIPDCGYKGIKRIEIPKSDIDFAGGDYGLSILQKYLPSILAEHKKNASKIEYFWNYKNGLQDIQKKTRLYNKDSLNNNIITENHASRQVDFKVGLSTSEIRDYTIKSDIQDVEDKKADITYLGRYFTDCNFFGKDKTLKEWIFATGIGTTFACPRTDIGYFDMENEAPFEFDIVDPRENFVVYSSARNKQPLFCVQIVEVEQNPNSKTITKQKEIHIETRYASFIVNTNLEFRNPKNWTFETVKGFRYLPMIEHSANISRIGLVELNRELFNAINTLVSSVEDMVVDNANVILVFKNTDITGEQVQEMKSAGAIIISDSNNARQGSVADLDTITIEIPFEGLNKYYEQRINQAYDIAGVPLASAQISSGGSTGQAVVYGGGWSNAYTIIKSEINSLLIGDYELLKLILQICKMYPDTPIDRLFASQIDIKYRINQNDNFLVKAQGIMNLYSTNMPKEEILKASGLFSDVGAVARKWEEADQKAKEEARKSRQTTSISETKANDGNNSENE